MRRYPLTKKGPSDQFSVIKVNNREELGKCGKCDCKMHVSPAENADLLYNT